MPSYKILVVGATGAQGSATITALAGLAPSHHPDTDLKIIALTRSADAPKARALADKHPQLVELVQGDLTDPAAVLDAHSDIDAVFLVTVPPNDEAHGVAFIDAAIARGGIRHIVFSSVDRGGDDASWDRPTTVGHFAAKHRVELHLRAAAGESTSTRWTILRPSGFMDNYRPGGAGSSMMAGLWETMPADTKMQLVSVRDIGKVAAAVLLEGPDEWAGRAVGLAGDELTFAEADAAYQRVCGHAMPRTWDLVSRGVRWAVADARQSMEWFEKEGFKVDTALLRREGHELLDFESWLRSEKV
ncbi:hypothetical protein Micbo1qcDRAFT_167021 [Microdochium bolleyi]|uniref:NmrA-like domain-containing protein n=1 Tax=Microdochium bolleyi TaxID=196109 RepID=A0A136ISL8_9PEZI|nr:hypothetical protein Micbo1qcDRAFT_167021 [Microdochium bolleyi]